MKRSVKYTAPILILLLVILLTTFIFRVREIEISNTGCVSSNDLEANNKIIFLINPENLASKLEKQYLCAQEIKIDKIYPQKLQVNIKIAKASVQIAQTSLAITPQGLIIEGSSEKLPLLYPRQNLTISSGQKVADKAVVFSAQIAALLAKTDFATSAIRIIESDQIAAYNQNQTVVIFNINKDANIQLDSLQQVLAKAKISDEKISKIDLRFAKPVVVFK